jgi:hypothetical protein
MKTTSPPGETAARLRKAVTTLPSGEHYRLLGVTFSLQTDSRQVRDFFAAAYRRFRTAGSPESASLRLVAVMAERDGGPLASAGESILDLSGRPMPENRAFLFLLNAMMDRVSDFAVVHGGAVSVGGRGIILAGPPTAGKSTLVLELARRGARFLSDDVAPLQRRTGLLMPFPRAIGIRKDAGSLARFVPGALPAASVHELPHKWLVDPQALGINVASPDEPPCPVEAVLMLDGIEHQTGDARSLEIAMVEAEPQILGELRGIEGISGVRRVEGADFPLFRFEALRSSRPMQELSDLCRRRRDVILYLDESRQAQVDRPEAPEITEAHWSTLLMDLTRDLLNRSDTGLLMASCGGLPALIAEMGRLLRGARAYRLRPGHPERTADLVLALAARSGGAHIGR